MIPRSLVPVDVRPAADTPQAAPRRLTTLLDDRSVVAANLPNTPLDTRSTIPSHLPLGVLASRVVVPRDTPTTPLSDAMIHPDYEPVTVLDERVTVPVALPHVELASKGIVSVNSLPEVVESDVFTTGEINLMVTAVEKPTGSRDQLARIAFYGAATLNVMIFLFIAAAALIPYRPPTQQQVDLASQQLTPLLAPSLRGLSSATPLPARPPAPKVDTSILRKLAPNNLSMPAPAPRAAQPQVRDTPTQPTPDLPATPQPQTQQPPERAPDISRQQSIAPIPQTQTPTNNGLVLPKIGSPSRSLEEAQQGALNGGSQTIRPFGGQLPGGGGGFGRGGGGGGGTAFGGAQILSPTDGVNFDGYMQRLIANMYRNWYAVMPESVYLGDKGIVSYDFCINKDGSMASSDPQMVRSSSKEPLDRAASGAIRGSSPFEPLPPAYDRPCLELRFTFLYNVQPSSAQ